MANFQLRKGFLLDTQPGFVDDYNQVTKLVRSIQGSGSIEVSYDGDTINIRDKTKDPEPNKAGSPGDDGKEGEDGNTYDDKNGNGSGLTDEIWVVTNVKYDPQTAQFTKTMKKIKVPVEYLGESETFETKEELVFTAIKKMTTNNL